MDAEARAHAALSRIAGLAVTTDAASRLAAGRDFGGLRSGEVLAIVRPTTADALVELVAAARRDGLRLTPRSLGLSQSGQSIPRQGISVDMTGFTDVVVDPASGTARCGSGATWRQLLTAAAVHGLAPRVMPFNLDLSIGGVLSAGGIGSTSHTYGFAISSVEAVDVVTGAGEHVASSHAARPEVLDAVLGNVGRFGFICHATLRLRPLLPLVRTWFLLYDDLSTMLDDERALMGRPGCTHLEGFAAAAVQGLRRDASGRRAPFARWFYGLHVSTEFAENAPPDESCLHGLRFRERLHVEDNPTLEYAARYDMRFAMMRATGAWTQIHPWVEFNLSMDAAARVLPELVPQLPLVLGDGHRMMPIAEVPRPSLFMLPSPGPAFGIGLLPPGVPQPFEAPAIAAFREVHERLLAAGGKRYLSGWLFDPDEAFWRQHYGDRYDAWCERKRLLDPDGVLDSMLSA